jgi:protein-L-isoaspartate(D-aspartate) O-methyltransferase
MMGRLDFAEMRHRMVEHDIARIGIRDAKVLAALGRVPRELFVPEALAEYAYDDSPLPIAEGQTISQPFVVALMTQAAEVGAGGKVLEIGTGSGYTAAVLAELDCEVHSIDRHQALIDAARGRLVVAGYGGIHLRAGDGTLGWPDAAPFDAIIVTAGGPRIPNSLSRQLRIGGRLVMPVGGRESVQRLIRRRRLGEDDFTDEDLGAVAFVPLIGAEGWPATSEVAAPEKPRWRSPALTPDVVDRIRDAAEPLPDVDDARFGVPFDRIADSKVVLLGEASHGTSEFHKARARITERLISDHGFSLVVVEADWPDAATIDRHVRHLQAGRWDEPAFSRFPTWMWRNVEVAGFVEWLRRHNGTVRDPSRRVGFHGMDLYSLEGAIAAVLGHLDKVDGEVARVARERYACLDPWRRDPEGYGWAALESGFKTCEAAVLAMLRDLLAQRLAHIRAEGPAEWLDMERNAKLIAAAEEYYRTLHLRSTNSWNLRDSHMFDTLQAVLEARGPDAKAVVWAHNSHIGDASATEMGRWGEINLGMLCRREYGAAATLVGFGTDRGTVAAATDWDGPMEVKEVRPALPGSHENLCASTGKPRFLLDLRPGRSAALSEELRRFRLERAIGVIYRPETERESHYFRASVSSQFDLYVWFDRTTAITPLVGTPAGLRHADTPETYPFGL